MSDIYDLLRTTRGLPYKTVKDYSLYNVKIDTSREIYGKSRVCGDISEVHRRAIIDKIISVGARYHLTYKDIAYALLICRVESGFNNDAAAGTTSASGLGQYTDSTAKGFKRRSKKHIGIGIEMYSPKNSRRFDVDIGVYGIIVAYLYNKYRADKWWGFKPEDPKYWQLIYMLHHDGAGYDNENGRQRMLRYQWKSTAISAYNTGIKPYLDKLTKMLSEQETTTKIKLTGNDDKPVVDKDYVVAVPKTSTQDKPQTLSSNRSKEKKEYTVVHGKTDSSGMSEPIKSNVGSEMIIALLSGDYQKLGVIPSERKYQVKSGDTLSKIAEDNNTTVEQIAKDNDIQDVDSLSIDQNLIIKNPYGLPTHTKHVVKSGDTLSKIAEDNNTTVDQIAKDNDIQDVNSLNIDQNLIIKNSYGKATHTKHVVKSGDTLSKIAEDNHTTVEQIKKDNNIQDVDSLSIDQELILPKYLHHKPSKSAVKEIMSTVGVPDFNLNPINFMINHVVKPEGTTSNSVKNKNKNTFELRTPVSAETVNKKIKKPDSPKKKIKHKTDAKKKKKETIVKNLNNIAPWMKIAIRKAKQWKGVYEGKISETDNYFELTDSPKEIRNMCSYAWCAAFLNYCLQETGFQMVDIENGYGVIRATAFRRDKKNFIEIGKPIYGAIAIYGGVLGKGHAAMVLGIKNKKDFYRLGANQSNRLLADIRPINQYTFLVPMSYYDIAKNSPLAPIKTNEEIKALDVYLDTSRKKTSTR